MEHPALFWPFDGGAMGGGRRRGRLQEGRFLVLGAQKGDVNGHGCNSREKKRKSDGGAGILKQKSSSPNIGTGISVCAALTKKC